MEIIIKRVTSTTRPNPLTRITSRMFYMALIISRILALTNNSFRIRMISNNKKIIKCDNYKRIMTRSFSNKIINISDKLVL